MNVLLNNSTNGKDLENGAKEFCLICKNEFPSKHSLARHINQTHKTKIEEYKNRFSEKLKDPRKTIQCEICKKFFIGIKPAHVKKHKMSILEYKQKFRDAKIVSDFEMASLKERARGENNPGWKHGGKLSPFSKNFIKGDISAETFKKAQKTAKDNHSIDSTLEYYTIKLGMGEKEAREALSKRQTTFTLEKCIQKHGLEEGTRIYKERQEKWQATLNAKPQEEIDRINRSKAFCNKNNPTAGLQKHYLNCQKELALLYLLDFKPENSEKSYIKFGITKQGIYNRWSASKIQKIISLHLGYCPDIYMAEQNIKKFVHEQDLLTRDMGFDGHTECLEKSEENIQKLLSQIPTKLKPTNDYKRPNRKKIH